MNRKGQLGNLLPYALTFLVAIITISVAADIVQDVRTGQASGTPARNISTFGLTSMETMGSWLPTLALVIMAGIVISVLVMSFAFKKE